MKGLTNMITKRISIQTFSGGSSFSFLAVLLLLLLLFGIIPALTSFWKRVATSIGCDTGWG